MATATTSEPVRRRKRWIWNVVLLILIVILVYQRNPQFRSLVRTNFTYYSWSLLNNLYEIRVVDLDQEQLPADLISPDGVTVTYIGGDNYTIRKDRRITVLLGAMLQNLVVDHGCDLEANKFVPGQNYQLKKSAPAGIEPSFMNLTYSCDKKSY
jgi:hypothetical protein